MPRKHGQNNKKKNKNKNAQHRKKRKHQNKNYRAPPSGNNIHKNKKELIKKSSSNNTKRNKASFCNIILDQKDIIKIILSFLRTFQLGSFGGKVFSAAEYIRTNMIPRGLGDDDTRSIAFNVLPLSLKRINKIFNECVTELSHLIVCIQKDLNIQKLSTFPNCRYIQQLHWIHDLWQYSEQEINHKINALNYFNFPCLVILQIHYFCGWADEWDPVDIRLNKQNLPNLKSLILGVAYNDNTKDMRINNVDLDLDIDELRINQCAIKNVESLRISLAKCQLIDTLFLILPPFDEEQTNKGYLDSLYLPLVNVMFVEGDWLSKLSIYAPELQLIQFFFCEELDEFTLLDTIPNELRGYIDKELEPKKENHTENESKLVIGFDNCYDEIIQKHIPNFTVLKGGKRWNEQCNIKFTWLCREMLVWPYPRYD